MAYSNALSAYRETRIRTASQGQLIVMLYDEAVKQLDLALEMIASSKQKPNSIERINKAVVKAQEIITELMASLDFEVGGDIAQNLFSLYNWFNRELLQANISKDEVRIGAVRNMLNDLRSAWQEIAARTSAEAGRPASGVNIAG